MSFSVLFHRTSGALVASALAAAPLNYGSVRAGGPWLLSALLGAGAVSWMLSLLAERRFPFTPLPVLLGLGALAFSALLWLSGFVQPTAATDFTRSHFARVAARWPHSVVSIAPGAVIALHAGLGLALWMIADLARNRTWALTFSAVIVTTAVVVALLAFAQNRTGATGILWSHEGRMPGRFWGTFFHHTSAGAYLNTAWPLAAALFLGRGKSDRMSPGSRAGVLLAGIALILLLGAHATHISRFPQFAALLVLPFVMWSVLRFRAPGIRLGRWAGWAAAGMLAIGLGAGRLGEIAHRWQLVGSSPAIKTASAVPPESVWPRLVRNDLLIPNVYNSGVFGDRGEAWRTAARAIAARPLTGHGPGNWIAAASRHSSDPYVRSFYLYLQFAHEDFLQAWVEWGVAGFAGILLLLPLAVAAAGRKIARTANPSSVIALCAAGGLAAVLLQSLLDFPLQIPAIALNAAALAGLCWASNSPRPEGAAVSSPVL